MRSSLAVLTAGALVSALGATTVQASAAELGISLEHLYRSSAVFEVVCVPDPPVTMIVRNDTANVTLGVKAIECLGDGTPQPVVVPFENTLAAGSIIDLSATVSGDSGEINNWWPGRTVEADPGSSPPPGAPPAVRAPTVPRALHAQAGPRRARLFWVAPARTGGAPVDRYQVRRGSWVRTVSAATRSYTFSGLRNGRWYALSVRAHNVAGFGRWARAVPVRPRPPARPRAYRNCAAMNGGIYPHGVGRPGALDRTSGTPVTTFFRSRTGYRMNDSRVPSRRQYDLDRDNDGIACERR